MCCDLSHFGPTTRETSVKAGDQVWLSNSLARLVVLINPFTPSMPICDKPRDLRCAITFPTS